MPFACFGITDGEASIVLRHISVSIFGLSAMTATEFVVFHYSCGKRINVDVSICNLDRTLVVIYS